MHRKLLGCALLAALYAAALPALACRPFGSYELAEDARGGVWFTEGDNNAISRLAPDGQVVSHRLPTANAEPSSIALDARGNVWFTEMDGGKIGRLSPDGKIAEYAVEHGSPFELRLDRHGLPWYTQSAHDTGHADHTGANGGNAIGHVDAQGGVHTYAMPQGWPTSVAVDARGGVWAGVLIPDGKEGPPRGQILRLGKDGAWRADATWEGSCPRNLRFDAHGRLHFTDGCRGDAGYRMASGEYRRIALPKGTNIQQTSLTRDGTVWFTDRAHIGRIDPAGKVHLVARPDNGDATMAILASRNGDVLFSEFYNYNINRYARSGEFVEHLVSVDERHGAREVKEGETCRVEFGARIAAKAEMDRQRAEEVRAGHFKADPQGADRLANARCLVCHDTRRLLLSRRTDWTPSIERMQAYMDQRQVPRLSETDKATLVHYFNTYYGLGAAQRAAGEASPR